jgi:hypothetical protein
LESSSLLQLSQYVHLWLFPTLVLLVLVLLLPWEASGALPSLNFQRTRVSSLLVSASPPRTASVAPEITTPATAEGTGG